MYEKIPETTLESINLYVTDGVDPGGFVVSVLENDLKESFARADLDNRAAMFEIVNYCYNRIPSTCWGSPDRVDAWMVDKAKNRKG